MPRRRRKSTWFPVLAPIHPELRQKLYEDCKLIRWQPRAFRAAFRKVLQDPAFKVRKSPFILEYIAFLAGISPSRLSRMLGETVLPRLDECDDAIAVAWAIGKLSIAMRNVERHGDPQSRRRLSALFGGSQSLRDTYFCRTGGFVDFVRKFEARAAEAAARLDPTAKLDAAVMDWSVTQYLLGERGFIVLGPMARGEAPPLVEAELAALTLHVGLQVDSRGVLLPGVELDRIVADFLPTRATFFASVILKNLSEACGAQVKLLTEAGRPIDLADFVLVPQGQQREEWVIGSFENVVFPVDVGRPKVEFWIGDRLIGSRDFAVETR